MGRHRAPGDDDEPVDEPSDNYPESEDFGDAGGYREPAGPPVDEPSFPEFLPGAALSEPSAGGFLRRLFLMARVFPASTSQKTIPGTSSRLRSGTCPPLTSIRRTTSLTFRGATRSPRRRPRGRRPVVIGSSPISAAATATRRDGAASASEWSRRWSRSSWWWAWSSCGVSSETRCPTAPTARDASARSSRSP